MIAEEPRLDPDRVTELAQSLETELARLIVGQKALVRDTVITLIAGGHMLLEGVPGLGKTVLVRSLGQALKLTFARIQFTPDLMPADIVGTNIIREERGRREFQYQAGPLFANLVLADEVNRRHRDAGAAGSFLGPRDAEPDRARRHVSATRGAARQVLLQIARAFPKRGRAPRDRAPNHGQGDATAEGGRR